MAKSDFICKNCKSAKGTDRRGNPTVRYECGTCGNICRECVTVRGRISRPERYCNNCEGDVLLYEFNSQRERWEKA